MKPLTIFYVYYHSYDDMPIHVSDVIEELVYQKDKVYLFTAIESSLLKNCSWRKSVKTINIPVVNIRILNRLCYSLLLFFMLPLWCMRVRPDFIYERISFSTVVTAIISRLMLIPIVSEVNGIVVEELRLAGQSSLRIELTKICEWFSLKYSDLSIAVTEDIKKWLVKTYNIPRNKIEVVTNGTNVRRFFPRDTKSARDRFHLPTNGKFYVGYLGTLTPWCGVELLIKCADKVLREFPDVEFLVGGGQEPYLSIFQDQVKRRGLQSNFRFYGNIPWSEAPFFISSFDLAVLSIVNLPSGTSPQKLYSYLACNKPVIGSDTGEVGEVLKNLNAGLVFTPGDYESLGDCILKLLRNSKLRNEMGQRGYPVVDQTYSWNVKVKQLKEIICQSLNCQGFNSFK